MKVDWSEISKQKELTEEFMSEHIHQLDKKYIYAYQPLSESFLTKQIQEGKIDWKAFSHNIYVSLDFFEQYTDFLNWTVFSSRQNMSLPFIQKHEDKLDFNALSYNSELTEDIIRFYKEHLSWEGICGWTNLSEPFIEEMLPYIKWSKLVEIKNYHYLSFKNMKTISILLNFLATNTSQKKLYVLTKSDYIGKQFVTG